VLESLRESAMEFELGAVFGLALPALVYGFLSGGWVTRIALEALRRP
jgi:hypothetical protein